MGIMRYEMLATLQRQCSIIWVVLLTAYSATGLKDVRVSIPYAVRSGDNVLLTCYFNIEGDALYSVKWYKGEREFYRYTPKENPPMKIFPFPDLDIEGSKSNATQIVLRNVVPSLSGHYSCEVSADAPSFHTALVFAEMVVVVVPKNRPMLSGLKPRYRIGDVLRTNCTSVGSRPAANLTWTLNGKPVEQRHVRVYKNLQEPTMELESAASILELPLSILHFSSTGRLKVRCTASLYNLYWQTTEKSAEEERQREKMHNDVTNHLHVESSAVNGEGEYVVKGFTTPTSPSSGILWRAYQTVMLQLIITAHSIILQ